MCVQSSAGIGTSYGPWRPSAVRRHERPVAGGGKAWQGQRYERTKKAAHDGGKGKVRSGDQNDPHFTGANIAKLDGVGEATVKRNAAFARGVDSPFRRNRLFSPEPHPAFAPGCPIRRFSEQAATLTWGRIRESREGGEAAKGHAGKLRNEPLFRPIKTRATAGQHGSGVYVRFSAGMRKPLKPLVESILARFSFTFEAPSKQL